LTIIFPSERESWSAVDVPASCSHLKGETERVNRKVRRRPEWRPVSYVSIPLCLRRRSETIADRNRNTSSAFQYFPVFTLPIPGLPNT